MHWKDLTNYLLNPTFGLFKVRYKNHSRPRGHFWSDWRLQWVHSWPFRHSARVIVDSQQCLGIVFSLECICTRYVIDKKSFSYQCQSSPGPFCGFVCGTPMFHYDHFLDPHPWPTECLEVSIKTFFIFSFAETIFEFQPDINPYLGEFYSFWKLQKSLQLWIQFYSKITEKHHNSFLSFVVTQCSRHQYVNWPIYGFQSVFWFCFQFLYSPKPKKVVLWSTFRNSM